MLSNTQKPKNAVSPVLPPYRIIGSPVVRAGVLVGPLLQPTKGTNVRVLLEPTGWDKALLSAPHRAIDASAYIHVLDHCQHASGSEQFLFHSGYHLPLNSIGIAAQAGLQSHTLRHALSFFSAAMGYLKGGSSIEISVVRGRCQVRYRQRLATGSDAFPDLKYTLGMLANFVCQAAHAYDPNLTIHYPNAQSTFRMTKALKPRFIDSSEGLIEFDARSLNRPMSRGHNEMAEILTVFMESNPIAFTSVNSVSELCGNLIEATFAFSRPTARLLADLLGLNVRSLQRKLEAEGTTFRQVLENARKRSAMADLNKGERIIDTAFKLGYEHPQNFTAAFDKWYGCSPTDRRRELST